MKVIGLDGRQYGWQLINGHNPERSSSSFHKTANKLLKELFPSDGLLQEVSLPGTRPTLFADFVIPSRRLVVEVHGQQHYEWVPHFHTTKRDFLLARARDDKKKEWCQINNLFYIELPYNEDLNGWRWRVINFGDTDSGETPDSDDVGEEG